MENELFPREVVEMFIGHVLTDITFKKAEDKCLYMTLHFGEMTSNWRLPFTPAEHQLAVAEEALKQVMGWGCYECTCGDMARQALIDMEEFS